MTSDPTPTRPARRPWAVFGWVLLGVLCVQAVWILVVPPFQGLDEHDHAYKAAAVARGDWSPTHVTSPEGWGDFVYVPRDLVQAAAPICDQLRYTTPDNCIAGPARADGLVRVASSAARYNPAFYFVIGTAARPFSGVHALYAMRATNALLCAVLLAAAVAVSASWARTRWPTTAVMIAATPVLLYSTMVAAPNGIELSGAVLVWASLLGIARRQPPDQAPDRTRDQTRARRRRLDPLVLTATLGALPLVTVRALGPLWLALILLTVLCTTPRATLRDLVRAPLTWAAGVLVLAATLAAVGWTLAARTNFTSSTAKPIPGHVLHYLPGQWFLWIFQSVAAFPARNDLAPLALYALAFLPWWTVLAATLRRSRRRERWILVGVVLASTAVPVAADTADFHTAGLLWQGRYGYPYALGFILLCGLFLDRRADTRAPATRVTPRSPRAEHLAPLAVAVVYAAIEVYGALWVLHQARSTSALAGSSEWASAPVAVLVLLVLAGTALQCLGTWPARGHTTIDAARPADGRVTAHGVPTTRVPEPVATSSG